MTFIEFCALAKQKGCKEVLLETTEYTDINQGNIFVAILNRALIGSWNETTGGIFYSKPINLWSPTRRKFTKHKL